MSILISIIDINNRYQQMDSIKGQMLIITEIIAQQIKNLDQKYDKTKN